MSLLQSNILTKLNDEPGFLEYVGSNMLLRTESVHSVKNQRRFSTCDVFLIEIFDGLNEIE